MAKKTPIVGRSSRTPFKHWVLDSHLGQIVGSLSTKAVNIPARPTPFLCVDLCAGDGAETEDHEASPVIITDHCDWLASRGFKVKSILIEKQSATFETLEQNMAKKQLVHECELRNADAREFVFVPSCVNQAVFINCDPNAISDLPFAESLASSLTKTTTMTLTLGCNVGGLKMLKADKRAAWFDYMDVIVSIMPTWHDAILIAIESDAAQWAYLTRVPSVWSLKVAKDVERKGERHFPKGVRVESFRRSKRGFDDLVKRLFLTKAEVSNG